MAGKLGDFSDSATNIVTLSALRADGSSRPIDLAVTDRAMNYRPYRAYAFAKRRAGSFAATQAGWLSHGEISVVVSPLPVRTYNYFALSGNFVADYRPFWGLRMVYYRP